LKRLTLVIEDEWIEKVFYLVLPPGKNAEDVLARFWQQRSRGGNNG
jgi:hypothetical protein